MTLGDGVSSLAEATFESTEVFENITFLLKAAQSSGHESFSSLSSLCKIFSQLLLTSRLRHTSNQSVDQRIVVNWLQKRYGEYREIMHGKVCTAEIEAAEVLFAISFQSVKAESINSSNPTDIIYREDSTFQHLILSLLKGSSADSLNVFCSTYAARYYDVWHASVKVITNILEFETTRNSCRITDNAITLLSQLSDLADPQDNTLLPKENLVLLKYPDDQTSGWKKELSQAWKAICQSDLSKDQRRRVLGLVSIHIVTFIVRPEDLMDFITDSCDVGENEAIMALSCLFNLLQQRKFDYPHIYRRLYALVGANTLHKKQRSQFLRLLEKFLSSTHLPAAIVASFVKRLSRACLYSPPASIVAVVPLIYNLIQSHKVCSSMLHKTSGYHDGVGKETIDTDCFDAEESDPNVTGAENSSLWELDNLRWHWHPNVAAISSIMAEQFLRQSYNVEHFLDHSYLSLFSAEVSKTINKVPPFEHEVTRATFKALDDGTRHDQHLIADLWQFK